MSTAYNRKSSDRILNLNTLYYYRISISSFRVEMLVICFESNSDPNWKILSLLIMVLGLNLLGNEELQWELIAGSRYHGLWLIHDKWILNNLRPQGQWLLPWRQRLCFSKLLPYVYLKLWVFDASNFCVLETVLNPQKLIPNYTA